MWRAFSLVFMGFVVSLQAEEFSAEKIDFFERKIRPVLAERCYECHSAESKKLKAELQLDHREHLLSGGDTGPSIVPGSPDTSLLIETIAYESPDLQMPPKGPLDAAVVDDFRKWIADGAAWPNEPVPERGSGGSEEKFDLQKRFAEHWSWREVKKPALPGVKNEALIKSPIDHFILSKVEAAGLLPAEPADKRTLLRRSYFDLIGLPPTPEQIERFLSDDSADAFEKVVDELLASPHFGEKWARHWMDLVRYAETYGHEFDYPLDYAHEYRDYLIRAFNADVPYDQFLKEHIAGDLLERPRRNPDEKFNESVIGTAFWYFHEATHAPTDVLQDEADHMDNQIDVFGKSFLGLTISCARCHDHKFDAISTADYYALTGYLHSSARQEYPLDPGLKRKAAVADLQELRSRAEAELEQISSGKIAEISPGRYLTAAIALIKEARKSAPAGDPWSGEVFDDFESGSFAKWKVEGEAFGDKPVGKVGGQRLEGDFGTALANSFSKGGDKYRGKMVSEPFVIGKPYINFLIGGGSAEATSFELWVDGKIVLAAQGSKSDVLEERSWEVSSLIGKQAELRIIDDSRDGWGHIEVDNIVFSEVPADEVFPSPEEIEAYASKAELKVSLLKNWVEVFTSREKNQFTTAGYFRKLLDDPSVSKSVDSQVSRAAGQIEAYREEATLIYQNGDSIEGWSASGFAFEPPSDRSGISFEQGSPFAAPGVISSSGLGRDQNGVLRSPTFTITGEGIHVKARAENLFARVVIDNYHMAKFSGLLFGGTIQKNHSTGGESKWFSFGSALKKYIGHNAYLEFVDKKRAVVEIEEIWMAGAGAPPAEPHPVVASLSRDAGTLDEVAANLNQAWVDAWESVRSGKGERTDTAFLNWMAGNGLFDMKDLSGPLADLLGEAQQVNRSLPPERYTVAMAEGTREEGNVYIRGSHRSKGESVLPRNLTALGGKEGDRLELASQLVAPGNPLVSRVMVNRIWHHLFGRGIVPSVDDFGPMGQMPSHPELLDWLASDFVEKEWSIKRMIREVVLSNTYQQDSAPAPGMAPAKLATIDPENILLSRMPVRRLQAEAIRDAVIAVSGRLESEMFGPSVPTHRTQFMSGRGARGSGPLDGAGRRSIYGAVYRNFLSPLMLTFDQPGPFGPKGRRSVSNVPAQALALMNDPFVIEQSKYWVEQDVTHYRSDRDRIAAMYEKAIGVEPGEERLGALKAFLDQQSAEYGGATQNAWADLGHVILNLKDFIYLK
ncbi:MAG: PSD1 and planctomycete cytochrome C domain-containing protein [Verrucomicrobiales bacterium]|nr:PSD1 and planctomycete cytochrome C domain-containing protein [Verrucomicrobiales bacterium]